MSSQNPGIKVPASSTCHPEVRRAIQQVIQKLGLSSNAVMTGLTLNGATASKLLGTDASKALVSVDIVNFVSGTSNQVTITDDGDGTITVSLPQDIHPEANPTFNDLHLNGDFTNHNANLPDMGAEDDSDIRGVHSEYITDKQICNCKIGSNAVAEQNSFRSNNGVLQFYNNGAWEDVVTNFRFREDDNGNYELEHRPIGFNIWVEVNSGNSSVLGLNGLPIVQNYHMSMGPYPPRLQLDGGTF